MNKEIKQKWVEALRSDKYEQARLNLHRVDEGYCCLGVLCDLVVSKEYRRAFNNNREQFYNEIGFLPIEVILVCGIETVDVKLGFNDRHGNEVDLMTCNDQVRLTFNQIADLIEYFL